MRKEDPDPQAEADVSLLRIMMPLMNVRGKGFRKPLPRKAKE